MKTVKVPVSLKATIARLNRKLAHEDQKVCKSRGVRTFATLGDYYIVNVRHNFIVNHHLDIVALAREEGCLAAYEKVGE